MSLQVGQCILCGGFCRDICENQPTENLGTSHRRTRRRVCTIINNEEGRNIEESSVIIQESKINLGELN